VMRPGFAIPRSTARGIPKGLLKGRSARIVVTMGMPAFFYRLYYRAHSLKSFRRNILQFCGVAPVRSTIIGMVEGSPESREDWLQRLAVLGVQGR
jgi:putative NADPH-quinone reductase